MPINTTLLSSFPRSTTYSQLHIKNSKMHISIHNILSLLLLLLCYLTLISAAIAPAGVLGGGMGDGNKPHIPTSKPAPPQLASTQAEPPKILPTLAPIQTQVPQPHAAECTYCGSAQGYPAIVRLPPPEAWVLNMELIARSSIVQRMRLSLWCAQNYEFVMGCAIVEHPT
jgi:hypothetical protein